MEGSDGSPPPSLCMIRAAELFPKPIMEKEDNILSVPFQELAGESVKYLGRTDDGVLALSNYRLFLLKNSTYSETSVPLGLIETAQIRDLFHLLINCKDASTVKCSFATAEQCSEWSRRIILSVGVPESLESLFAFPFYSWTSDSIAGTSLQQSHTTIIGNGGGGGGVTINSNTTVGHLLTQNSVPILSQPGGNAAAAAILGENCEWSGRLQRASRYENDFRKEVERLQFDLNGAWRISQANADFKLCPSYPQQILVPCCISDETLKDVANFRGSRRLPAVVWRHKQSGAVIARCSQPEVGWFGWRSPTDEQLLKALADACAFDRGEQSRRQNLFTSGESTPSSPEGSHEEVVMDEVRKILIVDARSYTSAVTNRARGGGCECIEYYPCAEIEFMNLGNIHVIRKSFHALRQLCSSAPDIPNWLGQLERTLWLQHLSGLLAASMTVCHAIDKKGRPVLVHCSDGWDRTPQIVATAQLCLDPYYRTVEGFKILCEREWLNFGHKFADRCGHGPGSDELNERCPVFIQWLDLVHQIHKQFPCSFEFSMAYLIKLAQHSHSCLFGTFLCNTLKERIDNSVLERTFSVWPFLSGPMYRNALYVPNKEKVLWPAHNVRDLALWTEVYLGSLGNQNSSDFPPSTIENNQESKSPMTKTRSYGDLKTAGANQNGLIRRSSDPNMTIDSHLMMSINHSDTNSVIDDMTDRESTPDCLIANIIHDTTEKLQNLTNELNQSDEEICKINKINNIANNYTNTVSETTTTATTNIKIIPTKTMNNDNNVEYLKHIQNNCDDENYGEYDDDDDNNDCIKNGKIILNHDNILYKPNVITIDNTINDKNNGINDEIHNGFIKTTAMEYKSSLNDVNLIKIEHVNNDRLDKNNGIIHSDIQETYKNGYSNDCVDGSRIINKNIDINNTSMMESIDLRDSSDSQNPWYGSVNTSTDTLVPMEPQTTSAVSRTPITHFCNESNTITLLNNEDDNNTNNLTNSREEIIQRKLSNTILPEVHCKPTNNYSSSSNNSNNLMDESILILPEHQKLEISISGKCETIVNNIVNTTSSHRRRRTSSSNSKNDVNSLKNINGSVISSATNSRFSTPGIRSLPLTPPAAIERGAPVAISCPDGLGHALSEENIRLQQIVYEHKIREDALLRELHGMRMALLKKTCPNCNNIPVDEHADVMVNEEMCEHYCCASRNHGSGDLFLFDAESANTGLDNIENLSVCSWEAVEDRSGPSSGASSTQPSGNVLWVPDHAVSRCTGCQTEFWLGRRKHHCRSCGQIFCSDCSEFWTSLPDERLYKPVRVCGPCYHAVTTRIQEQQSKFVSNNSNSQYQQHQSANNINNCTSLNVNFNLLSSNNNNCNNSNSVSVANAQTSVNASVGIQNLMPNVSSGLTTSATITTTTAMDGCKHTANPNEHRGHLKATTASN